MPCYIRKINRSKWEKNIVDAIIPNDDPDADAITGCTRTIDNCLSLWLVNDNSEPEIKRAILALVSTFPNGIETFHILITDKEEMDSVFQIKNNDADTPYKEMNSNHYDIVELKYSSLKKMSDVIINGLNKNETIRVSKAQSKEYLIEAIKNGSISKEYLSEKLQKELK